MLTIIPFLTAQIIASVYPLCFWISADDPLKSGFHRFHLGMPLFLAGVVLFGSFWLPLSDMTHFLLGLWSGVLALVTFFSWKKDFPRPSLATQPALLGIIGYAFLITDLIAPSPVLILSGILSGLILSASLYAMNLGHWYLNVHGLSLTHLRRAVYVFWALVIVRFLWNLLSLLKGTVVFSGMRIPLFQFAWTLEGFFLILGFFFGVLLPLGCLFFVKETVRLKNTQSATGILYVILAAVLLGDLAYKYYWLKYHLPL